MDKHLTKALTLLRSAATLIGKSSRELWALALEHKKISIPSAIALLIALGALGYFLGMKAKDAEPDTRREVSVVSVADVSSGEPITVIGEIRSVSEASVAPDSSGRVTRVYRSLGDYVSAGAAIAELENSSQRAAVAQAQASLDRAKSGSTLSGISVESAQAAAETARQSAYAAMYDAVRAKADAAFSNPDTQQPILSVSVADSQMKNNVQSGRVLAGEILARQASARTQQLSSEALVVELNKMIDEAAALREFLSDLTSVLSGGIATGSVTEAQIAGYRANAAAALSTVTALEGSLSGAVAGVRSSRENLTQGRVGESADVALAQASLDAAKAMLEKTIVRAPISGTINSISLEEGSFAAAGAPAVRIVNTGGLEGVGYLSERDLPRVVSGSSVRISGIADGRVSRVAPALDPLTRKAEVRVAILGTDAGADRFVAGQSATLEIAPIRRQGETAIFIPIASVKIIPDGAVVFIVSEGRLVSVPVTLGLLSGGKVEITSGLALENTIVEDARGLKEGQEVVLKGE